MVVGSSMFGWMDWWIYDRIRRKKSSSAHGKDLARSVRDLVRFGEISIDLAEISPDLVISLSGLARS
jgi:hypothetical protein